MRASERASVLTFPVLHQVLIGIKFRRGAFPHAPGAGSGQSDLLIVAGEPFIIGRYKITTLVFRDLVTKPLEIVGKYLRRSVLIKPLKLAADGSGKFREVSARDICRDDLRHR